jgi:hypothetical protein
MEDVEDVEEPTGLRIIIPLPLLFPITFTEWERG